MTIENDIIVIGGGFAGAFVAMQCHHLGYKTCILNSGSPTSSLFSGCFDFLDDKMASGFDSPLKDHSLKKILDYLPHQEKTHPYTHLFNCALNLHKKNTNPTGEPLSLSSLLKDASDHFFKTFGLAVNGNGEDYYHALSPSGILKPTAYILSGLGGMSEGFPLKGRFALIEIAGLKDYAGDLMKSVLKNNLATQNLDVEVMRIELDCLRKEYLSSLDVASYLDESRGQKDFVQKLKFQMGDYNFLVFPPVLGIKNETGIKQMLSREINLPFCEMISLIPSVPGMRVAEKMREQIAGKNILVNFKVTKIEEKTETVLVSGIDSNNKVTEIVAKYVVLAGGKEFGDSPENKWKHSLLNLDLFDGTRFMTKGEKSLTTDDEESSQSIFKMGLKTDLNLHPHDETKKYERILVCGHALSGFDFAVERCGFGVSVLSASLVANILGNYLKN